MSEKKTKAFWDREQAANLTRKKDISRLAYLSVPLDKLPFQEDAADEILDIQEQLVSLSQKRILNMSDMTNTEIKLTYGQANLEALTEYDTNFILLIRLLSRWSQLLYEQGKKEEALIVLNFSLCSGSDLRSDYLLLARLYAEQDNRAAIDSLISRCEQSHSLTKDSLLSSLAVYRAKCNPFQTTGDEDEVE